MTKQTENKVMSKTEQMAAFKAAFSQPKLTKIKGLEHLDLYTKRMTVGEVNDIQKISEEITKQENDDGLDDERKICLELFAADGSSFFDRDSATDLQFLRDMPYAARKLISDATWLSNNGAAALKND